MASLSMSDQSLRDTLSASSFPLPKLPTLDRGALWDTVFTHQSLPDSNIILASLGTSIFSACITEWLLDADPQVTEEELVIRTAERTEPELLAAFADVYALPRNLQYARLVADEDRFSVDDKIRTLMAYTAALQRSIGYNTVKDWIYAVLEWDNLTMLQSLHE